MLFNLIHRPISGKNRDIFQLQQQMAHEIGLKVTLLLQYELMFDSDIVREVKSYHDTYGDEIGVWFSDMASDRMNETLHCKEPFLWLYNQDDKELIIDTVINKFHEVIGQWPLSVGSYHMDAYSMQYIKKKYPSVKISIAGCFEEGVKVFHGCNNSWYLFNEGMPWNPWYPSVENTLCPADSEEDWTGMVAVPHLSRDLALSFEGRNDFFATHPANVQRAMANKGREIPYVFNLLDLYRLQEKYNHGFSYANMFVGPGWLRGNPNVQDSDAITQEIYKDYLGYLASLKQSGELCDMYLYEFADWYTANVPIHHTDVYWAKEILYGSGKHYFWAVNESMRVLIDTCQGGSIGDLRPFVARQKRCTGPDTPFGPFASNPYLIHSQYRSGNSYHFADGARTTLFLTYGEETVDLCDYPVSVLAVERLENEQVRVQLSPAEIVFSDGTKAAVYSEYKISADGEIYIRRTVEADPSVLLQATEYFKGCYGVTEYPENLNGIQMRAEGKEKLSLEYAYRGRTIETQAPEEVRAEIPALETSISLLPVKGDFISGKAEEGYLFNPFYTLSLTANIEGRREMCTCLKLAKTQ